MVIKKFFAMLICTAMVFSGVSCGTGIVKDGGDGVSVVCTIFPAYDFTREIAAGIGDIDITLLLKPGSEAHSYEPTPQDIIRIQNCDIFVYVGGESDEWVKNLLDSVDTSDMTVIAMMDYVEAEEEEAVEGMQIRDEHGVDEEDEAGREIEYDEHVWTSPLNAARITAVIASAIEDKSAAENTEKLRRNTGDYIRRLDEVDRRLRDIADGGVRRTIVFGDRFPMRYFADEYGLNYFAAFPGCSSETEPDAKTVAYLIDKVKAEGIPVVFYPEMSNRRLAQTICDSTGAVMMQLSSCHNVTADEFSGGITYLELMEKNAEALKAALY